MHELFEELSAADPTWQLRYKSVEHAALALNLQDSFEDYLKTPAGQLYRARFAHVHDHLADNARRAAQIAAERSMAAQGARERAVANLEDAVRDEAFSREGRK